MMNEESSKFLYASLINDLLMRCDMRLEIGIQMYGRGTKIALFLGRVSEHFFGAANPSHR